MRRLAVVFLTFAWPAVSAADVVMPEPSCPAGWDGVTGHEGPECVPPVCEQSKCGEGAKCITDRICILSEKVGKYDSKWILKGSCDLTRSCPDSQRCLEVPRCSDQPSATAPVKSEDTSAKGCRSAGSPGGATALILLGLVVFGRRQRDRMRHAR